MKKIFDLKTTFYKEGEIPELLIEAVEKAVPRNAPITKETRFLLRKEIVDAKPGTVLYPALTEEGELIEKDQPGFEMFGYSSKYVGRRHFLHKEIILAETQYFLRIN